MTARHRDEDAPPAGDPDAAPVEITVLNGDPTPQELAAVTAVLSAIAQETVDDTRREHAHRRNAWERGQVTLRQPGQWGRGGWIDAARG